MFPTRSAHKQALRSIKASSQRSSVASVTLPGCETGWQNKTEVQAVLVAGLPYRMLAGACAKQLHPIRVPEKPVLSCQLWLKSRTMKNVVPGVILPPLPEKNVVQKYQMTNEFIEQRRRALAVFINRVVRRTARPTDFRESCLKTQIHCCHSAQPSVNS